MGFLCGLLLAKQMVSALAVCGGHWTLVCDDGLCVIIVVVLSGSRTGILSIAVMCIVCFLQKTEIGSRKKYLLLLLLLFPVFVTLLYFFKKDSADAGAAHSLHSYFTSV